MGEKIDIEKLRPVKWSSRKNFVYPFILEEAINNFYCLLCRRSMIDYDSLLWHFYNYYHCEDHPERVRQTGGFITPLAHDQYYCNHCQTILIDSKEMSAHSLKIERHLRRNYCKKLDLSTKSPTLSWNLRTKFVRPYVLRCDNGEYGKYSCLVCGFVLMNDESLEDHVNGKYHRNCTIHHGWHILPLEDNSYYCSTCDSIMIYFTAVYAHFLGRGHQLRLSNEASKKSPIPQPIEWSSREFFACPFVTRDNSGRYFCVICECRFMNDQDFYVHIKGQRHTDFFQIAGRIIYPLEYDYYYCCSCKSLISSLYPTIHQHAISPRHAALSKNESKTNWRKPIDWTSSENFACPFVSHENVEEYYCLICNCTIVGSKNLRSHLDGKTHAEAVKKDGCYISALADESCYCSCCVCVIPYYRKVYDHIQRENHALLRKMDERNRNTKGKKRSKCPSSKLAELDLNSNADEEGKDSSKRSSSKLAELHLNSNADEEGKEDSKRSSSKLAELDLNPNADEEKKESSKRSGSKLAELDPNSNPRYKDKEISQETIVSEQDEENAQHSKKTKTGGCNDCPIDCPSPTLADASFNNSNASCKVEETPTIVLGGEKDENAEYSAASAEADECKHSISEPTSAKSMNSIASNEAKVASPSWADSGFEEILPKTNANPTIKRTVDTREIVNLLDFYEDIYDLEDRVREITHAKKLCFLTESKEHYCLLCRKIICTNAEEYVEHVNESNHHEDLKILMTNHIQFELKPGEFSQYRLIQHCMISSSKGLTHCLVCDQEINHVGNALEDHVDQEQHKTRCEEMRGNVIQNFEAIATRMQCNWYKVCRHRCEPCSVTFDSEIDIALHLKSSEHVTFLEYTEHATTELIYDFCEPCALWWIGYRCTYASHCKSSEHKWFMHRGYDVGRELPESARYFLTTSRMQLKEIVDYLDDIFAKEEINCKMLISYLEATVKSKFPGANVCTFGSRESSLLFTDRRIEIYLGFERIYDEESSSDHRILQFMKTVYHSLKENPQTWELKELRTSSYSPVINTRHRETGVSCEIFFENGLVVDCMSLIKFFNHIFPQCQKLFLFLRQWLPRCDLLGHRLISSYALYWSVIFFLQKDSKLFRVVSVIAMREHSKIIDELSGSVFDNKTRNELKSSCTMKELLTGYFKFYVNFDFRHDVACPIFGDIVKKRAFGDPKQQLPKEMESYIDYMENSKNPEPFPIECAMCIQDPFVPQHNLTKAVSKADLIRFRAYCAQSLYLLYSF